jgi:hypothetical protein
LGEFESFNGHVKADGYHVRKGYPEGEKLLDDVFLHVIPVLLSCSSFWVLQHIEVGPVIVQACRNEDYGELQDEDLN